MRVHFTANAYAYEFGWNASCQSHTTFKIGPAIVEPNGDPVTDNYCFSSTPGAPWPDGQCTITPVANCSGSPDKFLSWSFPDLAGCDKVVDVGPFPYERPSCTYNKLPTSNAGFGNKTVTTTRIDNCKASFTAQLFFSAADDAVNHPGDGTGSTPNWFYYWAHTAAAYAPAIRWDAGIPPAVIGLTCYDSNGIWRPYIGPGGNDSFFIADCGAAISDKTYDGIDLFAIVWRHEVHESDMHMIWGYGASWDHPDDRDNDGIPDSMEAMYQVHHVAVLFTPETTIPTMMGPMMGMITFITPKQDGVLAMLIAKIGPTPDSSPTLSSRTRQP